MCRRRKVLLSLFWLLLLSLMMCGCASLREVAQEIYTEPQAFVSDVESVGETKIFGVPIKEAIAYLLGTLVVIGSRVKKRKEV